MRRSGHPEVIVVGGGIHGCSTAYHLAARGIRATVLEKDYAARHASGANAGGVRTLSRHPAEIPLSVASMEIWHRIESILDDDCGFESHGQLKVAETGDELEQLRRRERLVRELGFSHEEVIDGDELRRLVPALAPHCVGGIIARRDGAASPYRTTSAFRRKAEALGAEVQEGVRATAIVRKGGAWTVDAVDEGGNRRTLSAPVLVNAAGAWANRLATLAGEPVPLEPIAPMLMITERVEPFLKPVLGATGRMLSFKQFQNGTVLIGGAHLGRPDLDTNQTHLDWRKLATSAGTVEALFPQLRGVAVVRAWAGIEARMPDDIPVIGPSLQADGLFHQFGFSAHGFQLGPIVGSLIAELIATGRTNLPIEPFSVGRFALNRPGIAASSNPAC